MYQQLPRNATHEHHLSKPTFLLLDSMMIQSTSNTWKRSLTCLINRHLKQEVIGAETLQTVLARAHSKEPSNII